VGLRRALLLARKVGNRLTEGYALANLGRALANLGRKREAREALGQARTLARQVGDTHLASAATLYACQLDPIDADDEMLTTLLEDASPTIRASAHVLAAQRAARAEDAIPHASEALAIADAGLEEGEIEIRVAATMLLARHGDRDRAVRERERADERLSTLAARITDPEAREAFTAHGRSLWA
jgi:tetratricopeptide (TPR) repeat protein